MKAADALAFLDSIYEDKRRESLTMLLAAPGTVDADALDAHFAEQDRAFAAERERFASWLKTLGEGRAADA